MELSPDSPSHHPGLRFAERSGGMFLQVDAGTAVEELVTTKIEGPRPLTISLGKGAVASAFLTIAPAEPLVFPLEVELAEGSSLSLFCLQPRSAVPQKITQKATLQASSSLHCTNVTLGGRIEQEAVSRVEGADASSTLDWLFRASEEDQLRLSGRNVFRAPRGGGQMTVMGVAEGHADARCRGMIEIGEKGSGTDTYLTQNILMLDRTARVEAIPALEIKTDDVKASHSATVTKVSEEDLFYITSRGITREEARALYVQGFLRDILSRIKNGEARRLIAEAMGEA